jgi:hypothetical protein
MKQNRSTTIVFFATIVFLLVLACFVVYNRNQNETPTQAAVAEPTIECTKAAIVNIASIGWLAGASKRSEYSVRLSVAQAFDEAYKETHVKSPDHPKNN